MDTNFSERLEKAENLAEIFEVVKDATRKSLGDSRAGLMLGLADLGNHPLGFLGGFFTIGSNIIVMNRIPLQRIKETQPELYKPYAFHILLHEYLHSLGYINERAVRREVHNICEKLLGKEHLATKIASNTARFFPKLVYPDRAWHPGDLKIDLVEGFDCSSAMSYIG
ncbi:MAG: hypothetical protein SVM80_07520 [Halobacteriota archaeon]|nr:hypothetical protein [Halobacteriota archaeon]